jgi:hypothetical protein
VAVERFGSWLATMPWRSLARKAHIPGQRQEDQDISDDDPVSILFPPV